MKLFRSVLAPDILNRSWEYPSREAWLESRFEFIGASELAAINGLSTYVKSTPFRAWQSHVRGFEPDELTGEWLEWGHRLEPVILEAFMDKNMDKGFGLLEIPEFWCVAHPVYPRIRGTPDGLLWDLQEQRLVAGVDAKNMNVNKRKKFGRDGTDELIDDYVIQGLTYCEIFDVETWYFALLFGGSEYRQLAVRRDTATTEDMITRALSWWEDHVVTRNPPPVDGSRASYDFLRDIYDQTLPTVAPYTEEARAMAELLEDARARKKAAEADELRAKVFILDAAREHAGIQWILDCKQHASSETVDYKACFHDLCARANVTDPEEIRKKHLKVKKGNRPIKVYNTLPPADYKES